MAKTNRYEFLYASAEDGAWLRARALIEDIDGTRNRLKDHDDPEALHDFRVALRQLRTFIRAYHDYLPIGKKYRKALRDLARNTSEVRDLEVLVELLEAERKLPALAGNSAIDLLLEHLTARLDKLYNPLLALEARRWKSLRKTLRRHIDATRLTTECGYSFLEVTRDRIIEQTDTFERDLSALHFSHDDHLSHSTRITGKRLRYLIEPLRRDMIGAVDIVAELKTVQDALGDYHDAFVLLQHIQSSVHGICGQYAHDCVQCEIHGTGNLSRQAPLPAFLQLVQTIKSQRAFLWDRFHRRYIVDRDTLIAEIRAFAARLGQPAQAASDDTAADTTVLEIDRYRKIPG